MTEPRFTDQHALAAVIERGPLTMLEIWEGQNPDGMTISRKEAGTRTRKRNRARLQERLDRLVATGFLRIADGRYELGPQLGTVLVIYIGRVKRYTAVFNAAGTCLDSEIVPHVRETHVGQAPVQEARREELPRLLRASVRQLADVMRRRRWEGAGLPRAMALGLPAALDPAGDRVASDDPQGWKKTRLRAAIEDAWKDERNQTPDLPELPRAALPSAPLAITIDTDIVMDVIGAMYERPATPGPHYPATAESVMGVKCSGGVRSTLITRGDALRLAGEDAITTRRAGDRRDTVFRGRYGDTVGLGHSITLIHRACRHDRDGEAGENVVTYWERLCQENHRCSCGTATVPHLESFASHEAVARRLNIPPAELDDVLRRAREDDAGGSDAPAIDLETLRETGRLLGYALDNGVRLYDPEAVFLTGGVSYSDVIWGAIQDTAEVAGSERRSLVRVGDLNTDDIEDPIGPRGAARLAADTWIYPTFLASPYGRRRRTDPQPSPFDALPAPGKAGQRRTLAGRQQRHPMSK